MKYLVEHHETFYYRRKLQYQNFCLSLHTKNKVEAKFIINTINPKIELMRTYMNFDEEIDCKFHSNVSSHFTFMFPFFGNFVK